MAGLGTHGGIGVVFGRELVANCVPDPYASREQDENQQVSGISHIIIG